MSELRHIETVYLYFLKHLENLRITYSNFFKMQDTYKSENPLRELLNEAFQREIITKPEIFCNLGFSVELKNTKENQLTLLKECEKDPKTTYAIALCGAWSFIRVRKGASDIKFADRVIPTYPGKIIPSKICFNKKGKLKEDSYPHGWDEIDWEVYYLMKDPSISYTEAIRKSKREGMGLSRPTIKKRLTKILRDCKPQMNFFPKGYANYDKIFFTFRTEYEIGLYEALKKLDRTSFLWKVGDFVILILFVGHYCATVRHFKELEENGLIHDLTVSIPNRHYTPYEKDY